MILEACIICIQHGSVNFQFYVACDWTLRMDHHNFLGVICLEVK